MKTNQLLAPGEYHSQRNNANRPSYECGNTSVANLVSCISYKWRYSGASQALDNFIYEKILRGKIVQEYAQRTYGSEWVKNTPEQVPDLLRMAATLVTGEGHLLQWNLTVSKIWELIGENKPVLIASHFYKNQKNGHYVVVTGNYPDGFVIADPFGDPLSRYESRKGYGIMVPYDTLAMNFGGIGIHKV